MTRAHDERNENWCSLYQQGLSSIEIADRFHVTRERVCQILRKKNLIETRMQRRRLAAELLDQDMIAVKEAKERACEQLVAIVKGGSSIATAAAKVGFSLRQATWTCRKYGVVSQHGRWHNFDHRKARLRELVFSHGHTINSAARIVGEEENRGIISYEWVRKHCPDIFVFVRQRRLEDRQTKLAAIRNVAAVPSPREEKRAPPAYPTVEWSQERIAKVVDLWMCGASAQQISDIFGDCSRNAVIGQVHRLRVAGKLRALR